MVLKRECIWSPTLFSFMAFSFGYCSLINKERLISKERLINQKKKEEKEGRVTPGGQCIGDKTNAGSAISEAAEVFESGKVKSKDKKATPSEKKMKYVGKRRKSIGAGEDSSTDITIDHLIDLLSFCTTKKKNFGGRIAFHELLVNVKAKKYMAILNAHAQSKNKGINSLKEQLVLPFLDLMYLFNIYNLAARFTNLSDCEPGYEPKIGSISNRSLNEAIKMDASPIDLIIGIIDEHLKELSETENFGAENSDTKNSDTKKMSKIGLKEKDQKRALQEGVINKCYLTFYKGVAFSRKKANEAAESCFRIVIANEGSLSKCYVNEDTSFTYSYLVAQAYLELALLDRDHYTREVCQEGNVSKFPRKRTSISYQDIGKDVKQLIKKTLSFPLHLTSKLIEYRSEEMLLELKTFKRISIAPPMSEILEPLEG